MSDPCLITHPISGDEWREITCVYPLLKTITSKAEIDYDPLPMLETMKESSWLPIVAVVFYLTAIVVGKKAMADRDALKGWRSTMALWNMCLAVFSFMGTIRLLPYAMHNMFNMGAEEVFCHNARETFAFGSTGLWVQLFALSKFPELIDTFFIVINKRNLIFLHWYHHLSVVLVCWNSYVNEQPCAVYFCLLNYWVHSIMYFYYFLTTIRVHKNPTWKWIMPNPIFITFFQISQMVIGVTMTAAGFYFYATVPKCNVTTQNMVVVSLMYASYLFLFCQFFVGRYLVKVKTTKPLKSKKVL